MLPQAVAHAIREVHAAKEKEVDVTEMVKRGTFRCYGPSDHTDIRR